MEDTVSDTELSLSYLTVVKINRR